MLNLKVHATTPKVIMKPVEPIAEAKAAVKAHGQPGRAARGKIRRYARQVLRC
ncbi:MAG: hypothetical protein MZV70_57600 [Desulfobacterales bacterium]|nr:hypothetical protein [Desulfobacterales bacterium]